MQSMQREHLTKTSGLTDLELQDLEVCVANNNIKDTLYTFHLLNRSCLLNLAGSLILMLML